MGTFCDKDIVITGFGLFLMPAGGQAICQNERPSGHVQCASVPNIERDDQQRPKLLPSTTLY